MKADETMTNGAEGPLTIKIIHGNKELAKH